LLRDVIHIPDWAVPTTSRCGWSCRDLPWWSRTSAGRLPAKVRDHLV